MKQLKDQMDTKPFKCSERFSRRDALELATKTILGGSMMFAGILGISGCGAGSGNAASGDTLSPDQTRSLALNTTNRLQFEKLIAEVEPHLALEADGTLTLKSSTTRAVELSTEAKQFADAALLKTNALVKSGEAHFDENFNLTITNRTRANYTGWSGLRWWGGVFSMSTDSINALGAAIAVSGVRGAVIFFMKASVAASWATFVAPLLVGGWMWTIRYVNRTGGNQGVNLNVTWVGVVVVTPQT